METPKEIHDRMLMNVSDDYDKTDGSFIYDSIKPSAIVFSETQNDISAIQDKLDLENLIGDELTRFVYQRTGIERKKATNATTTVIISGSAGSIIKTGDLVGTDVMNYISLEDKVIDESGFMYVLIKCEQPGAIGNISSNSINKFPISITGLVNVYNPEAVVNGYEAESDSDLRQRYYEKLQRPGKAGNKYHYEEWAKSVTGVGDARCEPRWNGPLTVKVIIIDSNKQPADSDLITNVFNYIERERPFGADVTVVSATGISINISVTLSLVDGYAEVLVIENIKENITEYLREIAFVSRFVSYAKLGSIIIDTEGVLDYQDLSVNGSYANIAIGNEEIAIVGGVNK